MDLANEPRREWKTAAPPVETMIESRDAIGDLLDVIERHAGRFVVFEE